MSDFRGGIFTRNLIIKCQKSLFAKVATVSVYITDELSFSAEINGKKCRKLCELSSGQEKNFEIDSNSHKLFVTINEENKGEIGTVLDCYDLENGYSDVYLSGKISKSAGKNKSFAFESKSYFDISDKHHQKKMNGIILASAAVLIAITVAFAVFLENKDDNNLCRISPDDMEIKDMGTESEKDKESDCDIQFFAD